MCSFRCRPLFFLRWIFVAAAAPVAVAAAADAASVAAAAAAEAVSVDERDDDADGRRDATQGVHRDVRMSDEFKRYGDCPGVARGWWVRLDGTVGGCARGFGEYLRGARGRGTARVDEVETAQGFKER